MTNLILARHGQTDWNIEGRWQGHSDIPLNATGLEQARLLAGELTGQHFSAIYSSDLQRALVTAEAVAEPLGMTIRTDPRLREINLGRWEGRLVTEIPHIYPEEWAEHERDRLNSCPPGGESVQQLAVRVMLAFNDICAANPPEARILVVSHGLALSAFLCHVNGIPLAEAYLHIPRNATPVYLAWQPDGFIPAE